MRFLSSKRTHEKDSSLVKTCPYTISECLEMIHQMIFCTWKIRGVHHVAQYLIMATGLYVQCPIDRAYIDRPSDTQSLLNPYMQCPIDRASHTQSLLNPYMVGRWTSNPAAWVRFPSTAAAWPCHSHPHRFHHRLKC